jgi:hypothetical protein
MDIKNKTCCHQIMRGYHFSACGSKAKEINAKGEPVCGTHSDAAFARRQAKQDEAYQDYLKKSGWMCAKEYIVDMVPELLANLPEGETKAKLAALWAKKC